MAGKGNISRRARGEAVHVFRQFAWNLAGTLANVKAGTHRTAARPRPSKPAGTR